MTYTYVGITYNMYVRVKLGKCAPACNTFRKPEDPVFLSPWLSPIKLQLYGGKTTSKVF